MEPSPKSAIKNSPVRVEELMEALARYKELVNSLREVIQARDLEIKRLEYTIKAKEMALENYYHSRGWKALQSFYKTANRRFPLDSKRRKLAEKFFSIFWR
jgi:L-ribulose-5-phosphate 3-epimerase UlaE